MLKKILSKIVSSLPQIVALLFIGAVAVFWFLNQNQEPIRASASDNVSGYAWSDNIGWISFNNTSGGGSSFGVKIDINNGKLSGYAWSDNIGWISFNEAGAGGTDAPPFNDPCPNNDTSCIAQAEPPGQFGKGNVNVLGWARALSNGGGWDGWIRFDHGQSNPVYIDSVGNFHGWAWGSDVVGWINFNSSDPGASGSAYKVVMNLTGLNQPPDKPTFPSPAETWDSCSLEGVSKITLYWQYFDADGDPQDSYQILVDNNSNFASPEIDSCISPEPNTCLSGNSSKSYTPITNLNFSTTYYWKVKVKDNQGNWSIWSDVKSFTTPSHAYPWINFGWLPALPNANELIQFSSASTTFYGGAIGQSWNWDFGDSQSSSQRNPTHAYSSTGNFCVRLTATDSAGYSCQSSACPPNSTINIGLPLPEWKEISPF